jgi:hypothetical protein
MDGPFVSVESTNHVRTQFWARALLDDIAVRARHTSSATAVVGMTPPWLIRMKFADPAKVLAAVALDHAA